MDYGKIEEIINKVQEEWGVGGLDTSTMYGEFAMEVAKKAVAGHLEKIISILCDRDNGLGLYFSDAKSLRDRLNR